MALKKGDKAPDFMLYDTERKQVKLSDLLKNRTIVAFYPGAFTGVCTKNMCAFRDNMGRLNELSGQIIGISVDAPAANKAFAAYNNIYFPLLSDYSREVSKKYCGLYDNFAGLEGYTAAKRSAFVLDRDGTVLYAWITEDPTKEPDYDEIVSALAE